MSNLKYSKKMYLCGIKKSCSVMCSFISQKPASNVKRLLFTLLMSIILSVPLSAQIDNIFWFAAPDISANHAHNPITFCFTSFSSPATVTISQPANPSFTPVTINLNPYSYYALDVTNQENIVETAPVNTVCNYGFKIVSTANITTYYQQIGRAHV